MKRNNKWGIAKKQQVEYIKALTEHLITLRAKAGISQGDLSAIIGISRQTYSAIECKKRPMTWNTFLSLVFFFDYCEKTRDIIRRIKAFPNELIININDGDAYAFKDSSDIAGVPKTVTDKLDDRALNSIRTLIMVEYARCTMLPGEEVIRTFEGTTLRQAVTDVNRKATGAIGMYKKVQY